MTKTTTKYGWLVIANNLFYRSRHPEYKATHEAQRIEERYQTREEASARAKDLEADHFIAHVTTDNPNDIINI